MESVPYRTVYTWEAETNYKTWNYLKDMTILLLLIFTGLMDGL